MVWDVPVGLANSYQAAPFLDAVSCVEVALEPLVKDTTQFASVVLVNTKFDGVPGFAAPAATLNGPDNDVLVQPEVPGIDPVKDMANEKAAP